MEPGASSNYGESIPPEGAITRQASSNQGFGANYTPCGLFGITCVDMWLSWIGDGTGKIVSAYVYAYPTNADTTVYGYGYYFTDSTHTDAVFWCNAGNAQIGTMYPRVGFDGNGLSWFYWG